MKPGEIKSNEVGGVLGSVIRDLRTEKGLSQERLAELCELHRNHISYIERGIKQPTVSVLIRLAYALGKTAWELLREVEKTLKSGNQ